MLSSEIVINNFIECAKKYCIFIENSYTLTLKKLAKNSLVLLSELYLKVLQLPDIEPSNNRIVHIKIKTPKWRGFDEYENYWEIFNPYKLKEPVIGSLSDDLLDIYRDLRQGFLMIEQDQLNDITDAIWYWKFTCFTHWGEHTVSALRALHFIINKD